MNHEINPYNISIRLDPGFKNIAFNEIDCSYNCDRKSHHGPYRLVPFSNDCPVLVPRNPVGRTGI